MRNKEAILKTLEIITNKINPPYEKEIEDLKELIEPLDEKKIEELEPNFLNLRGVTKKPINHCDIGYKDIDISKTDQFFISENRGFTDSISSIITIDTDNIAVASGNKISFLNIKENRFLSTFETSDRISSITKIDEKTLCFGGDDGKVTILDISDKTKPIEGLLDEK